MLILGVVGELLTYAEGFVVRTFADVRGKHSCAASCRSAILIFLFFWYVNDVSLI
jgi:hypothetical protein